jgi:hypothetical protein
MRIKLFFLAGIVAVNLGTAASLEQKPADACFDKFIPLKAPAVARAAPANGARKE